MNAIEKIIDTVHAGIDAPRAIHRNLSITPLKNGFIVRHDGKTLAMVLNNRMRFAAQHDPKRTAIRYVNAVLIGLNTPCRVCRHNGYAILCRYDDEGFLKRSEVLHGREWFQL